MKKYLLVNTITALSLVLGLIAIIFALKGNTYLSFGFVLSALISDSLDGYMARKLKAESYFGAVFDTVVDIFVYLIYTAILLYHNLGINNNIGVFFIAIFLFAGIFRLVRFTKNGFILVGKKKYYLGMPVFFSHLMIAIILMVNVFNESFVPIISLLLLGIMSLMMVTKLKFRKPQFKFLTIRNYVIKEGIFIDDYRLLLSNLYKNYPKIAVAKITEYEKSFSPENPFFKYGNARNYFVFKDEVVVGHISAIVDGRFGDIGSIGFFECEDNQNYADILFDNAIKYLKVSGKRQCRGPINLTVWQNFRVSYPEEKQPFFLEPFTLEYYKDLFLGSNFIISHQNITTIELMNKSQIEDYKDFYSNSINSGYTFELLNKENFKENISNIYLLTNKIFEGSYSFYTISKEEFEYFTKQYVEMRGTHYIFIVKNPNKESVGFFFAIPDIYNLDLKRVVLKTMGILPEYRGLGLAKSMLYFVYKNATVDGFKEFVFSTMSIDNEQIKLLTGQKNSLFRKYEVYEKNII